MKIVVYQKPVSRVRDNINFLRKYMQESVGDLGACCEDGISSLEVESYPCYLKISKLVSFVGLLHLRQFLAKNSELFYLFYYNFV